MSQRWACLDALNFDTGTENLYRYAGGMPEIEVTDTPVEAVDDAEFSGRYAWTSREFDAEVDVQFNRGRCCDLTSGVWLGDDGQVYVVEKVDPDERSSAP